MTNDIKSINDISELLMDTSVPNIVYKHNKIKLLKRQNAYNLFSLSTYTSHLENFHSDIIASLLNKDGLHGEGNKLLRLFIEYLNRDHDCTLKIEDYEGAEVLREKGRIDIWIRNKDKCKAILIENKINNAGDRDGQIDDYHEYSEKRGNCKVEAIIYLSLDGLKPTPNVGESIKALLRNIGAFTNTKGDLVSGWLEICLIESKDNADTASLINQYIKLLKHLSSKQMDTNTLEDFYQLVNNKQKFESMNTLIQLSALLPKHRIDKFVKEITEISPFTTSARWQPNYVVYDHFREDQNSFKIDIHFMEEIGHASILFWNPPLRNEIGFNALTKKLSDIGSLEDFEVYDTYSYAKFFRLGEEFQTLTELDNCLVNYVKVFMLKLRESIPAIKQNDLKL